VKWSFSFYSPPFFLDFHSLPVTRAFRVPEANRRGSIRLFIVRASKFQLEIEALGAELRNATEAWHKQAEHRAVPKRIRMVTCGVN